MSDADSSLESRLRQVIRALVRRFSIAERADVACCGTTVAQAAALEALGEVGPMRVGDLGRRLGVSPSTMTRNLERLLERGLVERRRDPEDGRAWQVALTPQGEEAAGQVEAQEVAFVARIVNQLGAAGAEPAVQALEDLLRAVRSATESCCPGAFEHLMESLETPAGGDHDRPPCCPSK